MFKLKVTLIILLIIGLTTGAYLWHRPIDLNNPLKIEMEEAEDFSPSDWLSLGAEVEVIDGHRENQVWLALNESKAQDIEVLYEAGCLYIYVEENKTLDKRDRLFTSESLTINPDLIQNAIVYRNGKRMIYVKFYHAVE